jgi:hypothetical protein
MSRRAWSSAKRSLESALATTPHDDINAALNAVSDLETKSDELDEQAAPAPERAELQQRREEATERRPATEEESKKLRDEDQRVQYVASLDNNQLWERAHDPSLGLIVRVNSSHRLIRDVIDVQHENGALLKVVDILMFALARGEYGLVYKSDSDPRVVEELMDEYRERVGGELSDIIRQLDIGRLITTD